MNERERRLYSRQIILRELGQSGQAQLCAARVAAAASGDAAATSIALDYLQRAGLQPRAQLEAPPGPGVEVVDLVDMADAEQVDRTAGDPALRACAEWLHGAWAAVETIKRCARVGEPSQLHLYPLTAEID